MIELELFFILVVNILTLYVINKKSIDPSFNLQDKTKEEIKTIKKAWGKRDKYKPYINDDYTAWVKENTKA